MSKILINRTLEPIRNLLNNPDYKEIVMSEPHIVHIEYIKGGWTTIEDEKLSLPYLRGLCRLLAISEGKKFLSSQNPKLSASIDGKHRLNAIYGSQTNNMISIAIRLKRNSHITLDDFPFTAEEKQKLISLVRNKKTILISGGTSTGKTTLLNSLIKFIPPHERIITIEGVSEIDIDPKIHKNSDSLIHLEDSPEEVSALINTSLRMRPDRLILGELRQENSYAFLRACNTGHEGTISTIHANSPNGAINALIQNCKTSIKHHLDDLSLKKQIITNVDVIIQLTRESSEDGKSSTLKCYIKEIPKHLKEKVSE